MTNTEYKELIRNELNKAAVHYNAMLALAEQEGVDVDGDDIPTPESTPAPTPAPTPTPTPEPTPEPVSKDPAIVYNGPDNITLSVGGHTKFDVYVNNVNSGHDYIINTSGEPTYIRADDTGYKTASGYRLAFDVAGINRGRGVIKVYLAADKTKSVEIAVTVK